MVILDVKIEEEEATPTVQTTARRGQRKRIARRNHAQAQEQARANAPNTCPKCGRAINRFPSERLQTSCGRDACRQFISRQKAAARRAEEKAQAEKDITEYLQTLQPEQAALLVRIQRRTVRGYKTVVEIISLIEDERATLKRLDDYAKAQQHRAEKAERRIADLEAELEQWRRLRPLNNHNHF